MKKILLICPCLFIATCSFFYSEKLGPESYRNLADFQENCPDKIYPYRKGLKCASGAYDNFTVTRLTDFGQRAEWSLDGRKIAFLDKDDGNIFEIDLKTKKVKCITCKYKHNGFYRVHYLNNGDYLLLGRKGKVESRFASRYFFTGFYFMPADASSPPKWIGGLHYEGVAVSKNSRRIAYSRTWFDRPFIFPSVIYVADVSPEGEIINRKAVYYSMNLIEPQDFLPDNKGLTFSRYTPNYDALTLDFETGRVIDQVKSPSTEEMEGIFPDGEFSLIESDRHSGLIGEMDIDIYMLKLDGTGKDVRRLTHFSDKPDQKANNPVVSPEGCRIAFSKSVRAKDWKSQSHGLGAGIYVIEFYACKN